MSHFLDRLTFFRKTVDTFADGHGIVTNEDRDWEESYRARWQHDKIVRSTHGVNCTGSCSWKIYVKGGIITWETQQTDYPRTRPDLPNHEPRGCSRGASYSWYIYSANRLKYPLVRSRLVRHWREARRTMAPVAAWASIVGDEAKRRDYQRVRGLGGFVRSDWEEVNEIVAAANVYTIKTHGPDRVLGFSPIPAMSMVSYAAGSRYLSLIGGVCMSFYDWYCDLPPSSPQTWGEQTDVPESADWYNSTFLMMWGSNVPQTRTPDAHFMTEVRYKGATTVTVTPDYSEASKFADIWLNPKQGTDAALALAMGHVILKEWHLAGRSAYFEDYCRRFTDMPFLVTLSARPNGGHVPDRMLRASDLPDGAGAGQQSRSGRPWPSTRRGTMRSSAPSAPSASAGARPASGTSRKRTAPDGAGPRSCRLSLIDIKGRGRLRRVPLFRQCKATTISPAPSHEDGAVAQRAGEEGRDRRTARRWSQPSMTCSSPITGSTAGSAAKTRPGELRRRCALYAGMAGAHHRSRAGQGDRRRPAVRGQCAQDRGPLDGHRRGRAQPLVPYGHDLPQHHQHAGDVRLRGQVGRRLVPLCRAGEAAGPRPAGCRSPSRSTGTARRGT